ncbi:hypothetical protein [Sphingopyxis granuli]|uniref:hypothetical protein n=1 Tax=Sphingopyxis granuli TaxID=267128 RepID=UPI000831A974|nr:hypothetical protein [Sphingopyxis granuli]
MSAALPLRAAALREQLETLDAMGSNVQETALLTDLRRELAEDVEELERSLVQSRVLAKAGVVTETPASLSAARARAAALRDKFVQDPRSGTLKVGKSWTTLTRDLVAAATELAKDAKVAWKAYRGVIFTGDAPAVVRSRIAGTDQNNSALTRYESKHQAFRMAFETMPSSTAEIVAVLQLASDLKTIAGEFDFAVPDDVKKFLEAVQARGAALTLLTPGVIAWLKDNDAFDSYRIVAA